MDGTLFGWWITPYARETLDERLVSVDQLVDAILRPELKERLPGGAIYWGPSSGIAWRIRAHPETGEVIHTIEAALLRGPGQVTWGDEERYLSSVHDDDVTVIDLIQNTVGDRRASRARPKAKKAAAKKASTRRRPSPVEVRNVFDGVPAATMAAVRQQLEAMGRDPNDLSGVKRIGKRLEIAEE